MGKDKRVALYVRVSTDGQSVRTRSASWKPQRNATARSVDAVDPLNIG